MGIQTGSAMLAWIIVAFFDVITACWALKSRGADALEITNSGYGGTCAAVVTWRCRANIFRFAVFA